MQKPVAVRVKSARTASLSRKVAYPPEKIAAIKADKGRGLSYSAIMTKHGISSKGTVSYIINKYGKCCELIDSIKQK